jgi:hypothetical protein
MRLRVTGSLFAGVITSLVCASVYDDWFAEYYYGDNAGRGEGIDTPWGKALLFLGAVGFVVSLTAAAATWLRFVNLALSLGAIGVMVAAGATHQEGADANEWFVTNWYWAALTLTIAWALVALVAVVPFLRRAAAALGRWIAQALARDSEPPQSRVSTSFVAASVAAMFLLLGAIGPWELGILSPSGLTNTNDGLIVLAAGFLSVLALLQYWRLGSRLAVIGVFTLALFSAAVAITDLVDLSNNEVGSGWGINLAAAAAVALGLSAPPLLTRRPSLVAHDADAKPSRGRSSASDPRHYDAAP